MSKCSLSNPLLHFISSPCLTSFLVSVSTSSASFFFPSPDLAQHPAVSWLLFILLLLLTLPSLFLPRFFFPYATIAPFNLHWVIFFLLCYASCLSFVFSELSGFPQSLFPLPVAFHLPLYLFFSILHPLISPISSSHPFSLLSSLLHFSPILSPYIGSYISSSYSFLSSNSLFSSPLSRLAPFWLLSEYSGYSSFTDRKDLWMTTAGFHCHRKIATVLYYERDGGNVCTCVCVCLVPIRRCSTCRLMWPASCRYKNYSARWDST